MTFLDNLFNRNPTADWQAQRGLELVLDLGQETFCGIAFGDAASRVSKFGPAQDAKAARNGCYRYQSLGFEIVSDADRVVELELSFYPESNYGGSVAAHGRSLPLPGPIAERDVVDLLGEQAERSVHGEAPEQTVMLTYRHTRGDWQIAFDEQGHLEYIWGGKRE